MQPPQSPVPQAEETTRYVVGEPVQLVILVILIVLMTAYLLWVVTRPPVDEKD